MVDKTVQTIQTALERKVPMMGICLGHQLLALAAGGETHKLKFGHRSQNQPCLAQGGKRCYITTQNHSFAVSELPAGFEPWFINANDGSNEGMQHTEYPFLSVQFHPEAAPGPEDTEWIFDYFLKKVRGAVATR
jgi:carbamoyl-phosphate synthase small subunit